MLYSILIAAAVPLGFLYLIKWLNFFETHRPRLIFLAFAWGAVAMGLAYSFQHPLVPFLGKQYISTHLAPFVEEVLKSLILLYLVRRPDYKHFVDGAIYGFAAGIGFAVAENLLYLSRVDVNTGLVVTITRVFSASVAHGSNTAVVGIAVGGFPLLRALGPWGSWLVGLTIAACMHMTYNNLAWKVPGRMNVPSVLALAFVSLAIVVGAILWGLRQERRRLGRRLGLGAGVSRGEAGLIHRIEDLDEMLAPVEARFGAQKRAQVARVLVLAAQVGMQQAQIRRTKDREFRAELAAHLDETKDELKRLRRSVGLYAMSYVRSIVPRSKWSIWVRLGQAVAVTREGPDLWRSARVVASSAAPAIGLYDLAAAALAHGAEATGARTPAGAAGMLAQFVPWGTPGADNARR
ncbi:MAG: PrsW family glutamic-type intramembrane protease [Casimicrobiaceae bacterium]